MKTRSKLTCPRCGKTANAVSMIADVCIGCDGCFPEREKLLVMWNTLEIKVQELETAHGKASPGQAK